MSEVKTELMTGDLTNGTSNSGITTDRATYTVSEVLNEVMKTLGCCSLCTCNARVICTNATEDSAPRFIQIEDGRIHIGKAEELNRTNIAISRNFAGCEMASDGKCHIAEMYEEWIADKEWKEVDESSSQGEGKENLNEDTSYMVCVEHSGIIYFYDDGQGIKDFLDDENDDDFNEWALTNRAKQVEFLKLYIKAAKIEQLKWGIPWQVTLTQIAYESGWGEKIPHDIYEKEKDIDDEFISSNNFFGIKNFNKDDSENYVRSWTTEDINSSALEQWKEEQAKWAKYDEELINLGEIAEGKLRIKVIQPFRRFESCEEGIIYHSYVLMDDRYSSAWEYENNPFIYLAIIVQEYGTGSDYENIAETIMYDYFKWEDKEEDWKEYQSQSWKKESEESKEEEEGEE